MTEGYGAGTLLCGPDCKLFIDGCYTCGDGIVHMAEACDGSNFNGKSCQSLGYGGGSLVCAPNCKSIDTAGCTPLASCGNGVQEGAEQCDGAQLGGQTCISLGYDMGRAGLHPVVHDRHLGLRDADVRRAGRVLHLRREQPAVRLLPRPG